MSPWAACLLLPETRGEGMNDEWEEKNLYSPTTNETPGMDLGAGIQVRTIHTIQADHRRNTTYKRIRRHTTGADLSDMPRESTPMTTI